MSLNTEFETLYKSLNKGQKEAVDTIDGPVMVIAGPGTGKTTILTLRIANILKETDTAPENILALTFTEAGVRAMRKKLISVIGTTGHQVQIYTFHGFCNEIINRFPEYFGNVIGGSSITEVERIQVVEKILDESKYEYIKLHIDPYFYVSKILSEISNLKREGFTPEKYAEFSGQSLGEFERDEDNFNQKTGKIKSAKKSLENKLRRNQELSDAFSKYQKAILKRKQFDFEDMILYVIEAFKKDPDFLLQIQEEFQYILADEHQDSNNSQNTILELLASFHDSPNLFVVGDEKQAIYRFQGASLENFLYFKTLYKDTKAISLTENYRSTRQILDSTHEMIGNNKVEEDLKIKLNSFKGEGNKIDVDIYPNEDSERVGIVLEIKKLLEAGIPAEEISVIYRNNKDARELEKILEAKDIKYSLYSNENLLDNPDAQKILSILTLISNPNRGDVHAEVLFIDFLKLPVIKTINLLKERGDILEMVGREYKEWSDILEDLISYSKNNRTMDTVQYVISKLEIVPFFLEQDDAIKRLHVLDVLFREIQNILDGRPQFTIKDVVDYFRALKDYGISVNLRNKHHGEGIQMMTAHRSKGLEFQYVFIFGATDKRFGQKSNREYFVSPLKGDSGTDEDERRLFYVALTRAKDHAVISYAKTGEDGKDNIPSRFIDELSDDLKNINEKEGGDYKEVLVDKFKVSNKNDDIKEYLRNIFLEQPFSVTAFNNYLRCPWNYLFTNLIRIPAVKNFPLIYGDLIHSVLQEFFTRYREGAKLSSDVMMEILNRKAEEKVKDESMRADLIKKGSEALVGYFNQYQDTWAKDIMLERKAFAPFDVLDTKITLYGILDKIELDGGVVNVVDYKTGNTKSRNAIMGKTQTDDGAYYNQLLFYKLLLGLSEEKYNVRSATLDFIEPNDSGKYVKETFELSDEEVGDFRQRLVEVLEDIYTFKFLEKSCDDKECEYCKLRERVRI